ncbi:MAG: Gfo/Idh/MocA family protein [Planctomycetales bacterium]
MSSQGAIQVAILGATGRQGRRRADAVSRVPGLAVGLLADLPEAEKSLQELALRWECPFATNWEQAVGQPQIGAVIICTPNSRHAEMALAALAHGKHVLVEKPLADTLASAQEVTDAARRAGLILKTGFNVPFRTQVREALKCLRDGRIGELLGIRGVISHSQFMGEGAGAKWFCQPGLAGHGAWLDLGIHLLELAQRTLNDVGDKACAVTAHLAGGRVIGAPGPENRLEEECVAVFRTRGGRLVSIHASWIEARPFAGARMEWIGSQGRLEVDLGARTTRLCVREATGVRESVSQFEYVDPDPSWTGELQEFHRSILSSGSAWNPDDCSLEVHRLAFAAYESARCGSTLDLSQWQGDASDS